ncbi:MAG: hypothetical protein JWN90_590 [Parcubacteria group bacterium]|nr:hypothetical protein [Parcubacteria group bacterium]
MEKNFDAWSKRKKKLHDKSNIAYAWPREVWWCSLGINIGAETNGKHELFERPVIVLKVYNVESLVVLPLTSRPKDDRFHYKISTDSGYVYAKLTQVRVISNKRLQRMAYKIDSAQFQGLKETWKRSI